MARNRETLQKRFDFENQTKAVTFVLEVAKTSNKLNHHADIVMDGQQAFFVIQNHDNGSLNQLDFTLAGKINELFVELED